MIDILDPQARMLDQKQCSLQSVQSMKVCQKNDQVNHFAVLTDSTVQTALWQVITGQAPDALMKLPVLSPPTPVLVPTPTPVPDFTRFKGTWYAHARQLIIQPNGTASYSGRVFVWCTDDPRPPYDNMNGAITGGMNTQITFTSVNGNTANGSISLDRAAVRFTDETSREHKKVLIIISDGEFREETEVMVSANLLKKRGVVIVSCLIHDKNLVSQFIKRSPQNWPSGARRMLEIASELPEQNNVKNDGRSKSLARTLTEKKICYQINHAHLLDDVIANVFEQYSTSEDDMHRKVDGRMR